MDDSQLQALLREAQPIDRATFESEWHRLGLPEGDLPPIEKGRPRWTNLQRDVVINAVVERLQGEGNSFRKACARVAPLVNRSRSSVITICQKMRKMRRSV